MEEQRRGWLLGGYTKLVIAYLFAPVVFMIAFGFNNPQGRFNLSWEGFTLKYYSPSRLFEFEELNQAITHSLSIALLTAVIATILGTMIALALTRFTFRGRSGLNLFLFLPMASPEVVLGAALLSLFITLNISRGFTTVLVAHIMSSISYVVVTVKARTAGFDQNLEDAAGDLGASPWVAFWTVTFPLIWPGIMAAGVLAFVLSLDDYVITLFNNGGYVTLPLWIFGASRLGVPVQVNVLGTLIFMVGVIYAIVSIVRTREGRVRAPGVP